MHDDFFRINEFSDHVPDFKLPQLPDSHKWSKNVWATKRGDWLALFRPLNLALVFLSNRYFGQISKLSVDDYPGDLYNQLISDNLILPKNEDLDTKQHRLLIETARRGTFRFICILPTTACTLKCGYCHQRPEKGRETIMTVEEINKGLMTCAQLCTDLSRPVDILLYGGEPLLAFHITEEILNTVNPKGKLFDQEVRLSFTTAGTGLSPQQADLLARHDVFVILSVDGPPESNDPVRRSDEGNGSFAAVEQAYRLLKDRGCRVGISVTIGKHNIAQLPQHLEFLLDRFNVNDVGLNAFLHRRGDKPNPYQVSPEDSFNAFIEAFAVTRRYGVYAEQPFRRLKPFVLRRPLLKDCSSPGERLVLVPGGLMGFCDSCFPDNRYFYPIEDFPQKEHPDYRLWRGLSSPEMPECRKCPAMTVCGGACRYDASKACGHLDGVDPERCKFERAFLNWMIWELFDGTHRQETFYFRPSERERMTLFGNIALHEKNQPFTAGSYSE